MRTRLTHIAAGCRNAAREVFAFRGRRSGQGPRGERSQEPVWLASVVAAGTRYAINRKHPVVAGFLATTGVNAQLLFGLLGLIEQTVPIERIWLDVSDAEGAPRPTFDTEGMEELAVRLAKLGAILAGDLTPTERADLLLGNMSEPPKALRERLLTLLEGNVA
jgi:hypothetical protein